MPTFEVSATGNQILLKVQVSVPVPDESGTAGYVRTGTFDALVDDGAQRAFVSSNVAARYCSDHEDPPASRPVHLGGTAADSFDPRGALCAPESFGGPM